MLRPLSTNKATRLLLVGPPSSGKRTLAKQLLKSTKIFYSLHLLEELDSGVIDRVVDVDYVIVIMDMTNPTSRTLLEQVLTHLSPGYLLSKCSVVFTKVDMIDIWMLNEDQVRADIQHFGNPMTFYVNLKDEFMRKKTCHQLTRTIAIGTFQQRAVHPLGLQFIDTFFTKNGSTKDTSDNTYSEKDDESGLNGHDGNADLYEDTGNHDPMGADLDDYSGKADYGEHNGKSDLLDNDDDDDDNDSNVGIGSNASSVSI